MSTAITALGNLPPSLMGKASGTKNELTAGVESSYAIISYRGKVWRIKYRGEERDLLREDGDPRSSIEVVIVKAAGNKSKIFYANGYEQGSSAAPDCWSTDGLKPDPAVMKPVATACATCVNNIFGSAITPSGKPSKKCSDSKRLAIVPLQDIDNDVYGGPMLLRVPAGSLEGMASWASKMEAHGIPFYGLAVRIGFDTAAEYPKLTFNSIRILDEAEARKVLALRDDPRVSRVLNEQERHEPAVATPEPVSALFEQPPAPEQIAAAKVLDAPKPTVVEKKVEAPKAPEPVVEDAKATTDDFDAALEALMGD